MVMFEPQLAGHRGVRVIRGDAVVGVCTDLLDVTSTVSVSYGEPVQLVDIATSIATARDVAATSLAARPGHHQLDEAGWRVAVEPDAPIIRHLEARYRWPLESASAQPDLLPASVKAFLKHDRAYNAAAEELRCHPNTLRYRVGRFESVTGFTVSDTESIVSLAWLFEVYDRVLSDRARYSIRRVVCKSSQLTKPTFNSASIFLRTCP